MADLSGLAVPRMGPASLQSYALSVQGQGMYQHMSQVTTESASVSACWLAVSLRVVADPTVSEKASGRLGRMGLPWGSLF